METTYLAHHGVKGMKWGVRRYQNYDGTLKNAGKSVRNKYRKYARAIDVKDFEATSAHYKKKADKAEVKLAKAEANHNQKKANRYKAKISVNRELQKDYRSMAKSVKNTSLNDRTFIEKARIDNYKSIGRSTVAGMLSGTIAGATTAAITKNPYLAQEAATGAAFVTSYVNMTVESLSGKATPDAVSAYKKYGK